MNFQPRQVERAPLNLDAAICFDIETFKNCFTLHWLALNSEHEDTFEISQFKDDRRRLFQAFEYWKYHQIPMIGFNSISFDYSVLHELYENPSMTVYQIYDKAQSIIQGESRFGHMVWESERFAPQIDLYKIAHFDNRAKSTSLKALEFAMRSETIMECPLPFDRPLSAEEIPLLIAYNRHDVRETRKFAHFSLDAIKFRIGLMDTLKGDVLNMNDSKLGSKILEQRLGDQICYEINEEGRRAPRQTFRNSIRLADIIFPYVQFQHPEFQRVLEYMRGQTLTPDELARVKLLEERNFETDDGMLLKLPIKTKGVFSKLTAHVGGIDFNFGTGGVHGSVDASRWASTADHQIVDIDVTGLYPSIAIVNELYPEHLGKRFVDEYAKLPIERARYKKGTVQNAAFKLAANGTYGNSNNKYSVFYDPRFTMSITCNGQLLLCMLAEWLLAVDTLRVLTANTDGICYIVHRERAEHARIIRTWWERLTRLSLEEVLYKRLWVRDCNSYISESMDGKLKLKGAYWYPETLDDISTSSPPAWHKDFSALVCIRAAVAHMVHGADIERFIFSHQDKFDFMLRAKVDRSSKLMIGDQEMQRICRYYVALNGGAMRKVSPPVAGAKIGGYKRRNGISDAEWFSVMATIPEGAWSEKVHTKNKSTYQVREMAIPARFNVSPCNVASEFDHANINFEWYVEEARKLII